MIIVIMETWTPDLDEKHGPRYRAIADAISDDIESGKLQPGARLPTHRHLATLLGVTVGTVSRAYAEAERRGLVLGEVGRGTFIRGGDDDATSSFFQGHAEAGVVDLSQSVPVAAATEEERRLLRRAFRSLGKHGDLSRMVGFPPPAGSRRHREAGAQCLAGLGLEVPAAQVLVTAGGQHAMVTTLANLTRPGDVVLAEQFTYPGMKGLCNLLNLRLKGLEMDAEGLLPEAFERACREDDVKALYVIATLQNPTSAVLSEERRRAVADIARKHGVPVLEDDVYGFLHEERLTPISSMVPELGYFFTSTAKVIAPGLRVGYLAAPEETVDRLAAGIWATTGMAAPPMAEIVASWVTSGDLQRFVGWRRESAQERNVLAREILGDHHLRSHPFGFHIWLPLPEPWRGEDFVVHARRRGVSVTSAEVFVVGRQDAPHAIRISLMPVADIARLEGALRILAEILEEPPEEPGLVVV
jgi:DNA-binding transcriptional MocR family regulator